jgi:hypothetical protein
MKRCISNEIVEMKPEDRSWFCAQRNVYARYATMCIKIAAMIQLLV